jgi:hypothetical protein
MFAKNLTGKEVAFQAATEKRNEKPVAGRAYSAPELQVVGDAIKLVQGGGGMSGSDVKYYWYHFA